MPIHVHCLSKKIKALLASARRPEITTQQKLAEVLDISNSFFDKMLNNRLDILDYGNVPKDCLTENVLNKLLRIYYLPREIFLNASLEAFEYHIHDSKTVFEDILAQAVITPQQLSITSRSYRAASLVVEGEGRIYTLGELFTAHLQIERDWSVLLLCKSPQSCCSLALQANQEKNNRYFQCIESDVYRFDDPVGQHFLLAIVTKVPLPMKNIDVSTGEYDYELVMNHLGAEFAKLANNERKLYKLPFVIATN